MADDPTKLKEITDVDIENVWYVKFLKNIKKQDS